MAQLHKALTLKKRARCLAACINTLARHQVLTPLTCRVLAKLPYCDDQWDVGPATTTGDEQEGIGSTAVCHNVVGAGCAVRQY